MIFTNFANFLVLESNLGLAEPRVAVGQRLGSGGDSAVWFPCHKFESALMHWFVPLQ